MAAKKAVKKAVKQVRPSNVQVLPRVEVTQFVIETEEGKKMNAVDLAREAASIQRDGETVARRGMLLSQHMIQLAGTCGDAEVFRALMQKAEQEMGWGPNNPIPGTWRTLKSLIFKSWKDLGLVPGRRVQIPLIREGALVVNPKTGKPQRTAVTLSGINQLKNAAKAVRLARKAEKEPEAVPAATETEVPDVGGRLREVLEQLVEIYGGLRGRQRGQFLARLRDVAEEYAATRQ